MKPTNAQIEERIPVWNGLSEFFLDTELQSDDYERIARQLAVAPYSIKKMEEILDYEVYPACIGNLFSMAGEWSGFDPDWLREKITPRYDRRPLMSFSFFGLRHRFYNSHWKRVKSHIEALRGK